MSTEGAKKAKEGNPHHKHIATHHEKKEKEGFNPHHKHIATHHEKKEKEKLPSTDKKTDPDVDGLSDAIGSLHLEEGVSDEVIDRELEQLRELVRQHHETASTLNKQGSQLSRVDDKQEHMHDEVDEAARNVDEINSGCLAFIKCLFPCCFSCCSKCCTHDHQHQHEMEHNSHHPSPQPFIFAGPEQLKRRSGKLREMARLAEYLKTESQGEGKELDDQNHELDDMHSRVGKTTVDIVKVDQKASKIIKANH